MGFIIFTLFFLLLYNAVNGKEGVLLDGEAHGRAYTVANQWANQWPYMRDDATSRLYAAVAYKLRCFYTNFQLCDIGHAFCLEDKLRYFCTSVVLTVLIWSCSRKIGDSQT